MTILLQLLSVNTAIFTLKEVRVLRFFVGVVVSFVIAFTFDWPFAYIMPLFVAKFLGNEKPAMTFKTLVSIFLVVTTAFILGGILTRTLLPYPIVFLLVMTLIIFWLSYWNNSGGNELVITLLLVGFTLVPLLGLIHDALAQYVTTGFLTSCVLSILLTMIMHVLIPDQLAHNIQEVAPPVELPNKPTRVKLALLSTLMVMPVMAFFFYFNLTSEALILLFIAIMAQKPDLVAGVKGSKALLIGNTLGGLAAIAIYTILTVVPSYTFFVLLFALATIVFARLIFANKALGPLYVMAFSTLIVLISGATSGDSDVDEKFYTRIIQIACACFYVVFATILASPLIKKMSQS